MKENIEKDIYLKLSQDKFGDSTQLDSSHEVQTENNPIRSLSINHNEVLKRNWGNTFKCCFWKNEPILTLGPDWLLFIITLTIMEAVGFMIVWVLYQKEKDSWLLFTTIFVVLFQGFIYILTACLNPGVASNPYPTHELDEQYRKDQLYCKYCKIIKKENTYHCEDCDVCIEDYDHHCPWVGKCIGKRNLIPFYIFLGSTVFYFMYIMFASISCIAPSSP